MGIILGVALALFEEFGAKFDHSGLSGFHRCRTVPNGPN
ncbi:MAG: Hypothetical protein AJITA_00035 [Acetilactobacillus jinshanensis]